MTQIIGLPPRGTTTERVGAYVAKRMRWTACCVSVHAISEVDALYSMHEHPR